MLSFWHFADLGIVQSTEGEAAVTLVRPTSGINKWPKLSGNSLPDALAKHAGPAEGQFGPSTPDSN